MLGPGTQEGEQCRLFPHWQTIIDYTPSGSMEQSGGGGQQQLVPSPGVRQCGPEKTPTEDTPGRECPHGVVGSTTA